MGIEPEAPAVEPLPHVRVFRDMATPRTLSHRPVRRENARVEDALSHVLRQAPFDKLRANGRSMMPFVVSLSNHKPNRLLQHLPDWGFPGET